MTLIISRIVLTLILLYILSIVWKRDVDIFYWIEKKVENTLPIKENIKPKLSFSVSAEFGLDPIDKREFKNEEPFIWRKSRLMYRFSILTKSNKWANNTVLGVVFYSADRLYTTESSLPNWIKEQIIFSDKPPHHRILHHTTKIGEINPANPFITEWKYADLSVDNVPWKAAIYLLEANEPPQWFQLVLEKDNPKLVPKFGSGVQVRDFIINKVEKPIISAGYNSLIE